MPTTPRRSGYGATAWLAVVLVCLSAALAAVLEALLVPLYAGDTLVPVAVVAAVASNVALPLLARRAIASMLGIALPYVTWLVAVIAFGVVSRPEGDVILPGGSPQWVAYGVLLGGALTGMLTVVTVAPRLGPPTTG